MISSFVCDLLRSSLSMIPEFLGLKVKKKAP